MSQYAVDMLRHLREQGPAPGEDFFRMKATGNGETMWFNVTPTELDAITAVLDPNTRTGV